MIYLIYPTCPKPVGFQHLDAALAFLRRAAGQISEMDFVNLVSATSGPA